MIQSLIKAIDVLEILGRNNRKYSIREIVDHTGFPASTVHRILQTLSEKNFVVWDEASHLYSLGPALIPLGIKATEQVRLVDVARPAMKELSEMSGEDVHLIIRSGLKGLFLEQVEGSHPLKIVDRFGPEVDLHCGAIRKSLLAYQSEAFIEEYIRKGLSVYTENTITDPEKLKESLAAIKRDGVASTIGEYIPDALGIGAPIFDKSGEAVASMGIIAPKSRISREQEEALKEMVKQTAVRISKNLGYNLN